MGSRCGEVFEDREDILSFIVENTQEWFTLRHQSGDTPAHVAAASGNYQALSILAEIEPSLLEARDSEGWTPAHTAAHFCRLPVLKVIADRAPETLYARDDRYCLPQDVTTCRRTKLLLRKLCREAGFSSCESPGNNRLAPQEPTAGSLFEPQSASRPHFDGNMSSASEARVKCGSLEAYFNEKGQGLNSQGHSSQSVTNMQGDIDPHDRQTGYGRSFSRSSDAVKGACALACLTITAADTTSDNEQGGGNDCTWEDFRYYSKFDLPEESFDVAEVDEKSLDGVSWENLSNSSRNTHTNDLLIPENTWSPTSNYGRFLDLSRSNHGRFMEHSKTPSDAVPGALHESWFKALSESSMDKTAQETFSPSKYTVTSQEALPVKKVQDFGGIRTVDGAQDDEGKQDQMQHCVKSNVVDSSGWQRDVATKQQERKWKALLGSMRSGSDITSMLIPADFLRPESALERLQDTMQHGRLLEQISACDANPVRRLLSVVRFHVSGIIKAVFDGKKPYNPVLGETCAWSFDHGARGTSQMVCEQVSHHPPVSAFHLSNRTLGITVHGYAETSPKFFGNSVDVPFKGTRTLTIHSINEKYIMTVPTLQYRGLLVGARGAEWVGNIFVRCTSTQLVCKLKFRPAGWFGMWGGWHRVEGEVLEEKGGKTKGRKICSISGHWDRGLHVAWTGTNDNEVLYNFDHAASNMRPTQIPVPHARLDTDSTVVWAELSEAIIQMDMRKANRIKTEIEKKQRRDAKKRDGVFQPVFYTQNQKGEGWIPREDVLENFHKFFMKPK